MFPKSGLSLEERIKQHKEYTDARAQLGPFVRAPQAAAVPITPLMGPGPFVRAPQAAAPIVDPLSPFGGVRCLVPLAITERRLGMFINFHSSIQPNLEIIDTPVNVIIHKNNTAPPGAFAHTCANADEKGTEGDLTSLTRTLLNGFTYTCNLENYKQKILTQLDVSDDRTHVKAKAGIRDPVRVDDLFEGACNTIENVTGLFNKKFDPGDNRTLKIALNIDDRTIIDFDFTRESLDVFLAKFAINMLTLNPIARARLEDTFRRMRSPYSIDINDIFLIIRFFRDVFGITQVNIHDNGCMVVDDSQGSFVPKQATVDTLLRKIRTVGRMPGNRGVGFGGKKNKKKTKKRKHI